LQGLVEIANKSLNVDILKDLPLPFDPMTGRVLFSGRTSNKIIVNVVTGIEIGYRRKSRTRKN
jgi:hypothetical protein